tara:strand:- start:1782 stop:2051 length:270 start_codon:yes stop_codon:yes gene_type:complete
MKDSDYKEELEAYQKKFNEMDYEITNLKKKESFLHLEIVKLFGVIKTLSHATRDEALEVHHLMMSLEIIENRLTYLYEGLILETEDIDY